MWCGTCEQDVPAVVPRREKAAVCCAVCGRAGECPATSAGAEEQAEADRDGPDRDGPDRDAGGICSLPVDVWDVDEDLAAVDPLLRSYRRRDAVPEPGPFETLHFDVPSPDLPGPDVPAPHFSTRPKTPPSPAQSLPRTRTIWLAWCVLSVGLMVALFGGVLLGWSSLSGREELWTFGLPLTLLGQSTMLVAVVLHLDALWRERGTRGLD